MYLGPRRWRLYVTKWNCRLRMYENHLVFDRWFSHRDAVDWARSYNAGTEGVEMPLYYVRKDR